MKHFSKRTLFAVVGGTFGALAIYVIWPSLEPMPDATPLQVNSPGSVDGAGTLRFLEYAKKAAAREDAEASDEQVAVASYIKERILAGAYGKRKEVELLAELDISPGALIAEITAMFLGGTVPWDALAVQKIVNLPENRELWAIFEEEEDFREDIGRLYREPVFHHSLHCGELITTVRLKIRSELKVGNPVAAREYFTKFHALLRFREREASCLLPMALSMGWRGQLENEIAEFFLAKKRPDAEAIKSLKACLDEAEREMPDFHEVLRRELNWGVAYFDYLLGGGDGPEMAWLVGGKGAWGRFRLQGLKKTWAKEALSLLPAIEARLPLEEIAQISKERQKDPYRKFRSYINIYGPFDSLEDEGWGMFSSAKSLLFLRTKSRNRISRAKLELACYEYRQETGVFPQDLSALVPGYLEAVPRYFPSGEGDPEESVYVIDSQALVIFPQSSKFGGELDEEGWPKEEAAIRLREN